MHTAASIALIFLIIESLLFTFVMLVLVGGVVFAVSKLHGPTKRSLIRGQQLSARILTMTRLASDKVAAPFIRAHAMNAGIHAAGRSAKKRVKKWL